VALRISVEKCYPFTRVLSAVLIACSLAMQGEVVEGIALARQGLDAAEEVGYQRALTVARSLGPNFDSARSDLAGAVSAQPRSFSNGSRGTEGNLRFHLRRARHRRRASRQAVLDTLDFAATLATHARPDNARLERA
jgi:hypothetical protein